MKLAAGGRQAVIDSQRRTVASLQWRVAGRQTVNDGCGLWMVIGVFWSFYNSKHSLPMEMLDFHGGR